METDLVVSVREWIESDPDPETREELETLLAAEATEQLADRMAGNLHFGTAGLRGAVEAGSNRMNRAVVIRTTRGIVDFLHSRDPASTRPVVIGRDARLSSEVFMADAVGVLTAAGIPVRYFPDIVPTPLVAYALRHLGARLGIVITASHNPPADNGYKVYDENGVQIVPPVDGQIAAAISDVGPAKEVPRLRDPLDPDSDLALPVPDDLFERYLEELPVRASDGPSDLEIVYTPLHGVGGAYTTAALEFCGHRNVSVVAEQFEPNGRFPTVAFPNPEEPGALNLALELADKVEADIIVANDPDVDRLAVAVPDRRGDYRVLTGNQIGVLLGEHLLARTDAASPFVVNSIVSSPMLAGVAAAHGAEHHTTLTGFKWIWSAALDLEAAGGTFVFGYEEALGYSVGPAVRDKDGISAAAVFAELAGLARQAGRDVLDLLGDLYRRDGLWVSTQHSIVRPGAEGADEIAAAMAHIGADPPEVVAGVAVTAVNDYSRGAESRPRYLPAASLIELELGERGRALVRPSGTEPKLKIYVDMRAELAGDWIDAEPVLLEEAAEIAAAVAAYLGI